mmetsp:Transcript_20229/g.61407  ORF Transcript_20229/g.61407 Transcript_20229/m.61407 type:complete len:153 (+) Transcript_20229:263-721(+)
MASSSSETKDPSGDGSPWSTLTKLGSARSTLSTSVLSTAAAVGLGMGTFRVRARVRARLRPALNRRLRRRLGLGPRLRLGAAGSIHLGGVAVQPDGPRRQQREGRREGLEAGAVRQRQVDAGADLAVADAELGGVVDVRAAFGMGSRARVRL